MRQFGDIKKKVGYLKNDILKKLNLFNRINSIKIIN